MSFTLDYDKMLILDAEDLAEGGIKQAYASIAGELGKYIPDPAEIHEILDDDSPSYLVKCGDLEYPIYGPALPDEEGKAWGRAAYAFFEIVNDQLANSAYRLYAINGGNDLRGTFLTQPECEAARRSLREKKDWPYLPALEHPWYGQFHG